jgi:serine/threonine protein kinase
MSQQVLDPGRDDSERELARTPGELDRSDAWLRALTASVGSNLSDAPHPGQIVDGKYRLGALLGHGGMGWVFEATHLQIDRQVALKYLRPGLRGSDHCVRRFGREARAAGRIDHPNVISIYDTGGEGPNLYIVMERLHGRTLRDALKEGPMPLQKAVSLMLGVTRGVAEIHRHGIVHRDIKPENIFLVSLPDGVPDHPKVLDFGISKIRELQSLQRVDHTASENFVAGTLHYMPLEQLAGEPIDGRADVYALGVVLYEMLTGSRPFEAKNVAELVRKLATESAPLLPMGPSDEIRERRRLRVVLSRALARQKQGRYATAQEFAAALSEVAPGGPDGRSPIGRSRVARSALVLLGCIGVFCAAPARTRDSTHLELSGVALSGPDAPLAQPAAPEIVPPQPALPRALGERPRRMPRSGLVRAHLHDTPAVPPVPRELRLLREDFE